MKSPLGGILSIVAALALIAAIVGSILLPTAPVVRDEITLGGTRTLVCAVGPSAEGTVGDSTVRLTDSKDLVAQQLEGSSHQPDSVVTFEAALKPVTATGTPMLGGVTTYTASGKTALVPCGAPMTYGVWNGVPVDQSATIMLNNVDPAPAVVDIFLYGQLGPIPVPGLRDISIPSNFTGTLLIDPLTDSVTPLTVVMRVSKGRIAGTIRMGGEAGIEWMVPQSAADTTLVITGIPGVGEERILTVTNTSDEKATFTLTVLSESGDFLPLGQTPIDVSAQDVFELDVTSAIGTQAATLLLESNIPLSASVTVRGTDIAIINAHGPLGAGLTFPGVKSATLWFSNPTSESVSVTVQADDGQGHQTLTSVVVPALSTASTEYPESGRVVLTPAAGSDIHAALVITDPTVSVVPLMSGSLASSVQVPDLDPALG